MTLTYEQHFIAEASDDVQSILRLQATAMDEFHAVTAYFGEDSKKLGTSEFFGIFSDFLVKFEVCYAKYRKFIAKIM